MTKTACKSNKLGRFLHIINNNLAYSKKEYTVADSVNKVIVERRSGISTVNFIGGFNSAISANKETVLCTLDKEYRPSVTISKEVLLRYTRSVYVTLTIDTDGKVILYNHTEIPSGYAMYICETFVTNI